MTGIVKPIMDLLESQRVALGLKAVEDVFGLNTAVRNLKVSPSAFVVRTGGRARTSSANTFVVVQDHEIGFDVIFGFALQALPGKSAEMDEVTEATWPVLIGWQHPTFQNDLVEARGDGLALLDLERGSLFWRQSYAFGRSLRST